MDAICYNIPTSVFKNINLPSNDIYTSFRHGYILKVLIF